MYKKTYKGRPNTIYTAFEKYLGAIKSLPKPYHTPIFEDSVYELSTYVHNGIYDMQRHLEGCDINEALLDFSQLVTTEQEFRDILERIDIEEHSPLSSKEFADLIVEKRRDFQENVTSQFLYGLNHCCPCQHIMPPATEGGSDV